QVRQLPGGTTHGELAGALHQDGEASGIISAVFESFQPAHEQVDARTRTDVSDDAAHGLEASTPQLCKPAPACCGRAVQRPPPRLTPGIACVDPAEWRGARVGEARRAPERSVLDAT